MKQQIRKNRSYLPNYIAADISDIDFVCIKQRGIVACFFDLDHTLLAYGTHVVDQQTIDQLKQSGLDIYIATNRRHSSKLQPIATQIGAKGIMHASSNGVSKPRKRYYDQVIHMTGHPPEQVMMVGDRVVQDIWGANRAGVNTLMLSKFGPLKWWDQPISVIDRLIPFVFRKRYQSIQKETSTSRRK